MITSKYNYFYVFLRQFVTTMPSLRKRVSSYFRQLSFHNEPREKRHNVNENSFVTKYLQGWVYSYYFEIIEFNFLLNILNCSTIYKIVLQRTLLSLNHIILTRLSIQFYSFNCNILFAYYVNVIKTAIINLYCYSNIYGRNYVTYLQYIMNYLLNILLHFLYTIWLKSVFLCYKVKYYENTFISLFCSILKTILIEWYL